MNWPKGLDAVSVPTDGLPEGTAPVAGAYAAGKLTFAASLMVVCLLLLVPLRAVLSARACTETWSDAGSMEGWESLNGDVRVAWDNTRDVTGTLSSGASNGGTTDRVSADSGVSGGAFVGDLIAAGALDSFRLMTAADIPEPGIAALLGLGLAGLALWRRRRR